jgi:glycosyltransferase involved in cell wall biosynthesis
MRVSVVIPAYNAEQTICRAVDSVKGQTLAACDIVAINDGSTDGTHDLLTGVAGIRYVQRQQEGVSSARNHGASLAQGDWLLFLDADDALAVDALAQFNCTMCARSGYRVYYGMIEARNSAGVVSRISGEDSSEGAVPAAAVRNFNRARIITPGAVLFSRELFDELGGFSNQYDTVADRDLYLRAGLRTEYAFCPHVIVKKWKYDDSMSRDRARGIKQGLCLQWDFLERFSSEPGVPSDREFSAEGVLDRALWKCLALADRGLLSDVLALAADRGVCSLKSRLLKTVPVLPIMHYHVSLSLERLRSLLTVDPGKGHS